LEEEDSFRGSLVLSSFLCYPALTLRTTKLLLEYPIMAVRERQKKTTTTGRMQRKLYSSNEEWAKKARKALEALRKSRDAQRV
jgi:hypothetical protein